MRAPIQLQIWRTRATPLGASGVSLLISNAINTLLFFVFEGTKSKHTRERARGARQLMLFAIRPFGQWAAAADFQKNKISVLSLSFPLPLSLSPKK
jgi:hypothetical protein